MNVLIFTDLDGSLMEHESYSIESARPALDALAARDIPVILNTSKTRAEIIRLQEEQDWFMPFVCENGAALYTNENFGELAAEFGAPIHEWLGSVHALREEQNFNFSGFSDWSASDVMARTGLNQQQAELALTREYSEPIEWRDTSSAMRNFSEELAGIGLRLLEGGRFFSIQGEYDKSNAMHWMRETSEGGDVPITIALGDSPNDAGMLESADIAVIIKSGKSDQIELQSPQRVIQSSRPGPAGWHDAIMEILELLDAEQLFQS